MPGETSDFSEDNMVLTSGFGFPTLHARRQLLDVERLPDPLERACHREPGPVRGFGHAVRPQCRQARPADPLHPRRARHRHRQHQVRLDHLRGRGHPISWHDRRTSRPTPASTTPEREHQPRRHHRRLGRQLPGLELRLAGARQRRLARKNSWGTGWGQSGYFGLLLRQLLRLVPREECGLRRGAAHHQLRDIYSYDPPARSGTATGDTAWGNVFTAHASQSIGAVGFFATTEYHLHGLRGQLVVVAAGARLGVVHHARLLHGAASRRRWAVQRFQFAVAVRLTTPGYNYPLASNTRNGLQLGRQRRRGRAHSGSGPPERPTGWDSTPTPASSVRHGVGPAPTTTRPHARRHETRTPTPTPTHPDAEHDIPGWPSRRPRSAERRHRRTTSSIASGRRTPGEHRAAAATSSVLYAPGTASRTPTRRRGPGHLPRRLHLHGHATGTFHLDVTPTRDRRHTVTYPHLAVRRRHRRPHVRREERHRQARQDLQALLQGVRRSKRKVTTQLAITTKSGAVKKRWSWGYDTNSAGWWYMKYTCRLPRGTYRIVVTGKDLAGNAQRVGRATLSEVAQRRRRAGGARPPARLRSTR